MSEAEAHTPQNTEVLTTRLNRGWVIKMTLFAVGLIGLGAWGTLDAFVVYPKRGEAHAKFMQYQYLGRLSEAGLLLRGADVADPVAELERLRNSPTLDPNSVDAARRDWLVSLSRVSDLNKIVQENRAELERRASNPAGGQNETRTLLPNPRVTLDTLESALQNATVPAPLNAYDIPLQYVFMAIGYGGGLWILLLMARCSRNVFRFEPAEMRLTLPDGRSFIPEQIKDSDKRDWHKYYLYFTIEGMNGEIKFDLLRYAPLEEWVEAMRRARPGYDPAEDEPKNKDEAPAQVTDAGDEAPGSEAETKA